MKKLFIILFTLAGIMACQKNNNAATDGEEPVLEGPTGVISVNIQTPDPDSKATSIADNAIQTVQLLVFGTDNTLETSKYFPDYTSSTDLKITAKKGDGKTLDVVLNSPRLNFSTLSRFENPSATNGNDLVDLGVNTDSHLIMVGKNSVNVVEYDPNKTADPVLSPVTVHVKRLTAKVVLDKITVDFRNTVLEGGAFSINQVYLVNVVGKSPYGVSTVGTGSADTGIPVPLPSQHFNQMGNWYSPATLSSSAPEMTFDLSINEPVCSVAGVEKNLGLMYLAYPNSAEAYQDGNSVTSPVHTALVIKATVSSSNYIDNAVTNKVTYYTFDLPTLEANKLYRITNISISMLGADNPGERVVTGRVNPTITVDDWTNGNVNLTYSF